MTRPRRIALVDLSTEFTGGQSYMKNLIALLDSKTDLWLLKLDSRLTVDASKSHTRVVDLGFSGGWGRALQIPLTMLVLGWLRLRYRLDAVWVNGYPEIALMPWARVIGCQAIATRHLTLLTDKPRWHWIRSGWRVHFLYERLAPAADTIICVSGAVADSLRRYVPAGKLAVIPNWIPILPTPAPAASTEPRPLRLLFVGRLIHHKGVALVLGAMRHIAASPERDDLVSARGLALTIVGEGEEYAQLKEAAAGLAVTFAGFHPDTSSFYQQADVFVNPTLGPEGLPLVSLDAMSYGLACIFSDIPVHREITADGYSAMLFRSGSAEDLARALRGLLKAPGLLARYGKRARETVEAEHGAEVARQRYVELLGL